MKRNKFAIATAIILGSIALWFYMNNGKGTIKSAFRNFSIEDPASINKIILTNNSTSIHLDRQPSGEWSLNGSYPVNSTALKSLLYTLKNIEVKEPVSKSAEADVIKDLVSNGVKCEIYQNNKLAKAYYVGTETADKSGTYMVLIDMETMLRVEKAFVTYIPGVDDNLAPNYSVEERTWRDHTVFHYNPADIRSVKMEVPSDPQSGYELSSKGGNNYQVMILSSNQLLNNIDTSSVKQYLSYFEQLNFENFESDLTPLQVDSLVKSMPLNTLSVTDNSGRTNKVTFYPVKNSKNSLDKDEKPLKYDPERMFALLGNEKDLVVVKFYEFGKILPPAGYFVKK